jgi:hypothetical protein
VDLSLKCMVGLTLQTNISRMWKIKSIPDLLKTNKQKISAN